MGWLGRSASGGLDRLRCFRSERLPFRSGEGRFVWKVQRHPMLCRLCTSSGVPLVLRRVGSERMVGPVRFELTIAIPVLSGIAGDTSSYQSQSGFGLQTPALGT